MTATVAFPASGSSASVAVSRWRGDLEQRLFDDVAEEVPVALEYNGISHAVMLASPADLDDFALGFSLSEGLINTPADLYDCEQVYESNGIRLNLRIASACFVRLKEKRRSLAGRTGCGLCGAESLGQVFRMPSMVSSQMVVDAPRLQRAFCEMENLQKLQQRTGASHAAAWLGTNGPVELIREDVGRHNALDKLVGALAQGGTDFSRGAALITSRASYEMVQKAAMLGIGFLAAVSAPTAMAIRLAEQTGLTLLGFVRQQGYVVYTHPERIRQ